MPALTGFRWSLQYLARGVKRRRFLRPSVLLVSLFVMACSSADTSQIQGDWTLDSLAQDGVLSPVPPSMTIGFDGSDQVSGNGPCNEFGGEYSFDGEVLKTEEVFWTLKGCLELEEPSEEGGTSIETRLLSVFGTDIQVHFPSDIRMQWETEDMILTFRRSP